MTFSLGRLRLSFSPALVPTLAFVLVLPLLLGLGVWQLGRAADKQALLDAKLAQGDAGVLDLDLDFQGLTADDRFRAARVSGHFDPEQQWLLDNRMRKGQVGYHVFSRLQLKGRRASMLVNRGWVAVGGSRQFLPVLPLPDGEMTLAGRLDTPASVGMVLDETELAGVADRVVVQSLDIERLNAYRNLRLAPLALVLDAGQPGALDYDWAPVRNIGPEKHLGYAVQWFALSLALAMIYFGVNTKRIHDGSE